ncbi:tetratricopeptide repeat-containing sensor histidine kinase [Flavivirga sp. 57AJ16]|uniref:tetratricopeptide repeat-containing sensor histidine kinase n=1 Tax=Flavivirga sp. 57AJ16 TaxID=3025307 RepID=UPI0023651FA6|nr:tetratricopeptide repeat-containing sensor histidine kinase [Flavivirga sp. 57AJ16]MDD7886228.1 hypothetical protein [Flavivirga sp. 57AJ16]
MKKLLSYTIFSIFLVSYSQEATLKHKVESLKQQIAVSHGGEKLKWMDSLCKITKYKTEHKYDSIAQKTIAYALELNAAQLALRHAKSLILYLSVKIGKPELAIEVFNDIKDKVPKNGCYRRLASFYSEGGDSYQSLNHLKEALSIYEEAHKFALMTNDSTLIGKLKSKIGSVLCLKGDFLRAAKFLQEASEIFAISNPELVWRSKRTLSILYSQNGLQEQAKKIRLEIIANGKAQKNYRAVYNSYYNQAFDEMLHGSQKERLRNIDSARIYALKFPNNDYDFQEVLVGQLSAYAENGLLEKAKAVKEELENHRKNSEYFEIDEYNLSMAHYEFAMGNYNNAAVLGEKEYNKVINTLFYEGIYMANKFLSKVYDSLGNHKKAYEHLEAYSKIKDSIETVQKANGFSYYQALHETEKKDAEIIIKESEIKLLNSENKLQTQWILFGGIGLAGLFSIVYLYKTKQFSKKKQKLQAEFSRNLIRNKEDQCTHVSRELHDGIGQKLILLTKKIKSLGNDSIEALATNTLGELRDIARGLHPALLESLGVSKAIESLINEVDNNTDIFFTSSIENIDSILSKEEDLHFYRIIQEILNNIVKHSKAKAASIIIKKSKNNVHTIIEDNGVGFDTISVIRNPTSLGMKTLLERAKILTSKINIDSTINNGTTINILTPIK